MNQHDNLCKAILALVALPTHLRIRGRRLERRRALVRDVRALVSQCIDDELRGEVIVTRMNTSAIQR